MKAYDDGMKTRTLILASSAIALTACSSNLSADSPEPTATVTATETVTATPTPPPAPEEPLAIGEEAQFQDFSVTMHNIDQDPAPEPGPQPERETDKWVSTDVEYCSHNIDGIYSSSEWTLRDAENRSFSSSSTGYATFPEPNFSFGDESIAPGECRRGWITFVVNKESELTELKYTGMSFQETEGHAARWSLEQ